MKKCTAFILLSLAVASSALQHVFKESGRSIHVLRDDFVKIGAADAQKTHKVVFAVKQKNLDQISQLLNEVSDPTSPKFGKFLTRDQVAALTGNDEGASRVQQFLAANGVTIEHTTPFNEYITARAPVAVWQNLLATTFYTFRHTERGNEVIRAEEYSVPADIAEHVEAVFNTIQLPSRLAPAVQMNANVTAAATITPAKLNSFYHVTSNAGNGLGSQSLYEALGQYYSPADLTQFQKAYGVPVDSVDNVIGGHVSDSQCQSNANNCVEANLDVQYIMALAQNVPTTYWYDDSNDDTFLTWIKTVSSTSNPPLVHSMSYGALEPELTKSMLNSFNTEAQKLGVQGVTIVASSGDDGVANFQARNNAKKCGYTPSFPASSPYVLAVGGTQGAESASTEIACAADTKGGITTGGGFSTVFDAPSFQTATIKNYFSGLSSSQKPASGYDTNGRGYPDVSLAAYNYEIIVGGKMVPVSGTSASAPAIAGFISLVNAARLKAGKSALGYVNPSIYKYASQFSNDVTSGTNKCAAQSLRQVCCTQGFTATAGWDPVTGFGSVDFKKFYNVFYNL